MLLSADEELLLIERTDMLRCFVLTALVAGFSCSSGESGKQTADSSGEMPGEVLEMASSTCPDGLKFWEQHDICAPAVENCPESWQMPRIGGGCMVVGPRACLLQWNPASSATCELQELLTCPR